MNTAYADLAAQIGSRMCHDLVSPLGAIGNGVELLQMVHGDSPEMSMLTDAIAAANARIRLFRLAFGQARPEQDVRSSEMRDALAAFESSERVRVEWALPALLPRQTARKLALAAMCCETALAYGGSIVVLEGSVEARAARFNIDHTLWQPLTQGGLPTQMSPATIHFALLALDGPVLVRNAPEMLRIAL